MKQLPWASDLDHQYGTATHPGRKVSDESRAALGCREPHQRACVIEQEQLFCLSLGGFLLELGGKCSETQWHLLYMNSASVWVKGTKMAFWATKLCSRNLVDFPQRHPGSLVSTWKVNFKIINPINPYDWGTTESHQPHFRGKAQLAQISYGIIQEVEIREVKAVEKAQYCAKEWLWPKKI